jgi:hypothetical protein
VLRKLKGWESLRLTNQIEQAASEGRKYEKFTLEGFLTRLIRWIAVDDQVSYFPNMVMARSHS